MGLDGDVTGVIVTDAAPCTETVGTCGEPVEAAVISATEIVGPEEGVADVNVAGEAPCTESVGTGGESVGLVMGLLAADPNTDIVLV